MISSMIVRALVLKALTIPQKTIAELRVFDGALGEVDPEFYSAMDSSHRDRLPFVCIYIGSCSSGNLLEPGAMELVIEMVIPAPSRGYPLGNHQMGLEATADLLERQVRMALSDPQSDWANLLKKFCVFGKVTSLRASSSGADSGVKFVARQLTVELERRFEPVHDRDNALVEEIVQKLIETSGDHMNYFHIIPSVLDNSFLHLHEWWNVAFGAESPEVSISSDEADALGIGTDPDVTLPADPTIDVQRADD